MSKHQTNFHVRMPSNYQCMITLFEITSFVDNMQRESRNKLVTRLLPTSIWHKQFFDILQFLRERQLCITNFTRVVFPHSYIQHSTLIFHISKIKERTWRWNIVHADFFMYDSILTLLLAVQPDLILLPISWKQVCLPL